MIGRRAPGITQDGLAQQLQPGLNEYASRLPLAERQLHLHVSGVEGTPLGRMMALFLPWLLGAAVFLTLLIACANVAILVIAQWTAREQEIAIRASLGASRGRIVQALVTESILMAAAGGLLGICATFALRGLIVSGAGEGPRFFDLSIDPRILIQSAVIAVAAGALAGIGPALLETRRLHGNPMRTMRSSDRVRQRWRHTLVVLETTVTVALLVVSTTMLDSYRRHLSFDPGFRTQPLASVRVGHTGGVPAADILGVLKRVPGVEGAAASTTIPFAAFGGRQRVALDAAGSQSLMAEGGSIGPEFFETLGVSIRAGRMFTAQDSPGAVTRRSQELALRVAIGATRADLLRFVAAHSVRLVFLGTIFGVVATFALSRVGRAAGGGGSMMDPDWIAFVAPVLVIFVIGGLATWIPSRRLRIDPSVLLRSS